MEKYLGLCIALVLTFPSGALTAQTLGSGYSQQMQENTPQACADPSVPRGEPCPENSRALPSQTSTDGYDVDGEQNPADADTLRNPMLREGTQIFGEDQRNQRTLGYRYPDGTFRTNTDLSNGRDYPPTRDLRMLAPEPPTEFQNFVASTLGQRLAIYGANLFLNVPSTFSPNNRAPVPPEYIIGPGDEIQIRIWGQINFSNNLTVDRSGNLFLPQVGSIPVAGLTYAALDSHIRAAISKAFRNFDLSVDLGRLHPIQIYVAGQARQPGAYTISSFSTIVDALFATGGPSPQGSLRHIILRRAGRQIADFDLYDLLLNGDKSKDVHLMSEDVIFIPPVGPQAALAGSVRSPAIYEVKQGESIGDLIQIAGGTTAVASNARLSLDRVDERRQRQAIDINSDPAGLATLATDGDIVRVLAILPAYSRSITIRGNLANPGRVGWHPGMKVSEVIPDRDALLSRDYWWKRSHLGLPSLEFESEVAPPTTLRRDLAPAGDEEAVSTQRNGSLAATTPTNSPISPMRQPGTSTMGTTTTSDLVSPQMQRLRQQQEAIQHTEVRVTAPGINWNYAVIERVDHETLAPTLIPFNLGKLVLEHDASQDLELQPGDVITIFSDKDIHLPLIEQVKYVQLDGEFVHAGYYSVKPGETLRDLVRRAGGLTPNAYLYGSQFTRTSTRLQQQQRMDEYVQTLTLDAERSSEAFALAPSTNGNSAAEAAASRQLSQEMITRLSSLKATGRIVLPFGPHDVDPNSIPAIPLENGDKFVLPFTPNTVSVVGAVYDQNSFVFQPNHTVNDYLRLAGGSNRNADAKHAFVVRADGSVISRSHMEGKGFFKQSFENVELFAGDSVVVPEKTLRPTALRDLIEWSQVFSQLALGAAAINVL